MNPIIIIVNCNSGKGNSMAIVEKHLIPRLENISYLICPTSDIEDLNQTLESIENYFEILSFNVPFLLVLDEKKHSLSKFGNEFIKDLKKMNLHFSNYNDLKSFLNKGNDINLWWFEEKRQKKLRNFKRKFSNTNYNYVSDWEKYFLV